jgi:hypothetical protein
MMPRNIKSREKVSWALPGYAISIDDFREDVKKVEKGPFYTVKESKQILRGWRKKRESR